MRPLRSHTTYNCIASLFPSILQFKVDRFLRNFSLQIYLLLALLPEICWEEVVEEIFFYISFWCLTWGLNLDLTSYKPTLDYCYFRKTIRSSILKFIAKFVKLISLLIRQDKSRWPQGKCCIIASISNLSWQLIKIFYISLRFIFIFFFVSICFKFFELNN